jgi:hypothetical protein
MEPATAETDDRIVSAVIYPSIGIARLGNSADAWFVGPEVTDPAPVSPAAIVTPPVHSSAKPLVSGCTASTPRARWSAN